MDESTQTALRAAEEAVARLLGECHRSGALYRGAPRAAAQVSRTGKWHLNAIAALRRALDTPDDPGSRDGQAPRGA